MKKLDKFRKYILYIIINILYDYGDAKSSATPPGWVGGHDFIIPSNLFNSGWMTRSRSDGVLEFKLIRGLYQ